MLSLIMALSLAAAPVPTKPTPDTKLPTASEFIDAYATICGQIYLKKVTLDQVMKDLDLKTELEKSDFVTGCAMYIRGVKDGIGANDLDKKNHSMHNNEHKD